MMSPGGPVRTPSFSRSAVVRAYDVADRTVVLGPRGAHAFTGDSAALCRFVLSELARAPATRDELLARVAAASGGPVEHPEVVDRLLAILSASGAILDRPERPPPRAARPLRVVLGVSGAIAAAGAPSLALAILSRGHELRVALTPAARRFASSAALEAITHHRVPRDLWDGEERSPVPHLALAEWADAVLVCPASATTISRLAAGDFSELVAAIALSAKGRVMIAPSMNPAMRAAPAVARNLERLVEDGVAVIHPAMGVEVEDAPDRRTEVLGPSPPHGVILELLESWATPRPGWDELWRAPGPHPWTAAEPEPELAQAIARHATPGALALDLGTGDGLVARALARLGLRVVATDVSPRALALAAPSEPTIVWMQDDARDTKLSTRFALITDRGCLHVLEPAELARWAASVRRLAAERAVIAVVTHAEDAPPARTTRHSPEAIASALGPGFAIREVVPTTLAGAPARLTVIERAA